MREKRKEGLHQYGFLLDNDVAKVAACLPKKRVKTLADVGLSEDASDAAIVKEAWRRGLTIITGNAKDFVREIENFQGQTSRTNCHEMWGLVALPNGYELQKRILESFDERLRKAGLRWADVADGNYLIRPTPAGLDIRQFDRCIYCLKNGAEPTSPARRVQ